MVEFPEGPRGGITVVADARDGGAIAGGPAEACGQGNGQRSRGGVGTSPGTIVYRADG